MRNLQIVINKLVGKVLINLLRYTKFIMLHKDNYADYPSAFCQSCTSKQIDLTSIFVTTAALLYQHVIVNKQM